MNRAIQNSPAHMCKTCRHLMLEHEIDAYNNNKSTGSGTVAAYHVDPNIASAKGGKAGAALEHSPLTHCPLCHSLLVFSGNGTTNADATTTKVN